MTVSVLLSSCFCPVLNFAGAHRGYSGQKEKSQHKKKNLGIVPKLGGWQKCLYVSLCVFLGSFLIG